MNSQTAGLRVASIVFGLICLGHLWRLYAHAEVRIGGHSVPLWASLAGLIVAGLLSFWMWRLSSARSGWSALKR